MKRISRAATLLILSCLAVSLVQAQGRGRGGARGGAARGGSPGGQWSQRSHSGHAPTGAHPGGANHAGGANHEGLGAGANHGAGGAANANRNRSQNPNSRESAAGAGAANRRSPNAAGGNNAAAGAAAANRRSPNNPNAAGAAAGAAAANRNQPTGKQGAAAGAAAANRNSPNATGAQGAAAGAAAANRNSPQYSGAAGAAAGAAAVNRNSPEYSGAQGAAAGAAMANRNQPNLSGAAGAAAGYASVRNGFNNPNLYGAGWYGDHPGAWAATGWAAGAAWQPSTWAAVANQCGYAEAAPVSYDYGVNVVSQDGNVLVNGQSVGTNEEFSQQASDLAAAGAAAPESDTDQWLPLGVFGMVKDDTQKAHLILQLAINQQGTLRGNYTDEVTDHVLPIHGAVDKTTQRAAWTVGGNTTTVMEAGVNDLTQTEAPALIHKNGQTDHWIMVRLDQPAASTEAPADPAADPAADAPATP